MPPKAKLPQPIDRPLSRAYMREFTGWSTAYPPGLSDPTSLRIMENVCVTKDGALRVRPGLRYLSYDGTDPLDETLSIVGSHEVFFLNDGTKAYLFAVREVDDTVGFRVAKYTGGAQPFQVYDPQDPVIGFSIYFAADNFPATTTYVKYLQLDNRILALSDDDSTPRVFEVGASKYSYNVNPVTRPEWTNADKPVIRHPSRRSIMDPVAFPPLDNPADRTSRSLRPPAADAENSPYNVGYFYTFSNQIGESAASKVKVIKVKRRWSAWLWETPALTAGGPPHTENEPSGEEADDEDLVSDQLLVWPSESAYDEAIAQGALTFNLYAMMWSDQDPVPIEGVLVGTHDQDFSATYEECFVRHSPLPLDASRTAPVPTKRTRYNYSDPSRAGQGLVAADRLVLVFDPTDAAVIRWTSNRMGEYFNFTANLGGGYKTLTSGNLFVPACVKLWQNPESKDTLTILCLGVDGYSTAYYMAPAQVTSQTDATALMGFEETTATPGTTSPYGCEVLNNSLYHPLETELTKSTASNYNINHKAMTDLIANQWVALENKINIVSSQLDNKLYYLVHNPEGEELEAGCRGNEIWVLDTARKEGGTWSRWLIQANSLRKIEVDDVVVMSVIRPEGFFCVDDTLSVDEYVTPGGAIAQRSIPWRIETNTQGANRAHDAWAHLQQVGLTVGNFAGSVRYGIHSWDVNGMPVTKSKIFKHQPPVSDEVLPYDVSDQLLVRRDLMEWRFFAESIEDESGVLPSAGQLNLVQYRYTPVSVNVGYEYGSVETFDYARATENFAGRTTDSGVPIPVNDTRRP